jgi:radical SAM superfamily enzyme YgiQ (UPF0313 family)
VTLINPPSPAGLTANREGAAGLGYLDHAPAGFAYPPQTIAQVAAVLRQESWTVRALDAVGEGWNLQETLQAWPTETAVCGVFVSYDTLQADLDFLAALRREKPGAPIIAFGPATRYIQEPLEQSGVAGILLGEAERSFGAAALESLRRGTSAETLTFSPTSLGLAGYDAEGLLRDLDSLPHPAWELLPVSRYRFLTVMSSRGCGDLCRFCPYVAAQGARFRARAPEGVVEELAWLQKTFSPSRIVFRDPAFAWDQARVEGICRLILERRLRLNWECESRPEHFDEPLLRLMKRAGCEGVKIGVETVSEELLHSLARLEPEQDAESYREHVGELARVCCEIGLRCRLFVMLGLPGQDQAALDETLRWLEGIGPEVLNVKIFQTYPGIRLSAAELAAAPTPREADVQAFQQTQRRRASTNVSPGVLGKAFNLLRRRTTQ